MSPIPDDIRRAAAETAAMFVRDVKAPPEIKTASWDANPLLNAIIAALMAERMATETRVREECAKLAESSERRLLDDRGSTVPITGRTIIAAAIRGQQP